MGEGIAGGERGEELPQSLMMRWLYALFTVLAANRGGTGNVEEMPKKSSISVFDLVTDGFRMPPHPSSVISSNQEFPEEILPTFRSSIPNVDIRNCTPNSRYYTFFSDLQIEETINYQENIEYGPYIAYISRVRLRRC